MGEGIEKVARPFGDPRAAAATAPLSQGRGQLRLRPRSFSRTAQFVGNAYCRSPSRAAVDEQNKPAAKPRRSSTWPLDPLQVRSGVAIRPTHGRREALASRAAARAEI